MPERLPEAERLLAELETLRGVARRLADEATQIAGGSATGVDRELSSGLLAAEQDMRRAQEALAQLARRT